MKRITLYLAAAGLAFLPALAWADRPCCGEPASSEVSASTETRTEEAGSVRTVASPCRPGTPCAAGRAAGAVEAGTSPYGVTGTCPQRTSYRLIRECRPVARVRTTCRPDPCNPCKVRRTTYTEWTNVTRYRWVSETRPLCRPAAVKISYRQPAQSCCGEVSYQSTSAQGYGEAAVTTASPGG